MELSLQEGGFAHDFQHFYTRDPTSGGQLYRGMITGSLHEPSSKANGGLQRLIDFEQRAQTRAFATRSTFQMHNENDLEHFKPFPQVAYK